MDCDRHPCKVEWSIFEILEPTEDFLSHFVRVRHEVLPNMMFACESFEGEGHYSSGPIWMRSRPFITLVIYHHPHHPNRDTHTHMGSTVGTPVCTP